MGKIKLRQIWQVVSLAVVLALVFCLLPFGQGRPVGAVTRELYWVADGGLWTNTSHWSLSSGGAGGEAAPDTDDNVHFDGSSFSSGGQTVTGGFGSLNCHDIDFTGVSNNPTLSIGNDSLHIYGTLIATGGVTLDDGSTIQFDGTGSESITWFTVGGGAIDVVFAGSGTFTLQNNLDLRDTIGSGNLTSSANYTQTAGTVDFNGKNVYCGVFSITGSGTRSLDLSTGTVYCHQWNATTVSNLTFDAATSTINFQTVQFDATSSFIGGGLTYYNISFTHASTQQNSFLMPVTGANTYNNFTVNCDGPYNSGNTFQISFAANQIINGNASFTGYSATQRLTVCSSVLGTPRQLTVTGTVSASLTDFRDIQGNPPANWNLSGTDAGNLGGNYGITFITPQNNYWIGNSGNWSDDNHWATTTGGVAGSGRVPVAGVDTAVFDASSFAYPSATVTFDVQNVSAIDATNVTNTPTFSGTTVYIYGDVIDFGTITYSITTTYFGGFDTTLASSSTMTTAMYVQKNPYTMNTLYLNGNVTVSGTVYLSSGVFNLNGFNLTASYFDSSTTTYARILRMGSGTMTLNGTAATTKLNMNATNLTVYAETSTLLLTNSGANAQSFTGGGKTYNLVHVAGAGNYTLTFTDANTITTLYIDRNVAAKTIAGNVTLTLTNFQVPVSGATVVTITNTDFSKASGTVALRYMSISGSAAGGGAVFFAGAAPPSTNGGGNSGWIFSDGTPPTLETYAAYDVYTSGATLSGGLITMGNFTPVYVFFEYGLSTAFGTNTTEQTLTVAAGFSQQVPNLLQDTTYYYRAVGRYYTDLYAYGDNETFVTELNESYATNTTPRIGTYGNATGAVPPMPDDLYTELNGTNLVMNITNEISDSAGMPRSLFWFIFAFLIMCLGGIISFNYTHSLALQFMVILILLFGFVVGIHILPFWMVFVYIIDGIALMVASKQFGY